jgi:hypothetical protein
MSHRVQGARGPLLWLKPTNKSRRLVGGGVRQVVMVDVMVEMRRKPTNESS